MKFWKFWWFNFVPLVLLNRSVYYLWKSVERFKSYSRGKIFGEQFPDCSPKKGFEKFMMIPRVFASWAESIGVLQVRIGWTGEKLFNSVCWLEIPFGGVFPKIVTSRQNSFRSVDNLECLAPCCADWANLSEKSHDRLKSYWWFFIKLEIPVRCPNLGGFWGKWTSWKFLEALGPQKALPCAMPRLLTYDRQNRPSRFCWARWEETNKTKKL
jgi:hypothetical protein